MNGFNQMIELSAATLGNAKFVKEKKLIEILRRDLSGQRAVLLRVKDTLMCLEMGAVEMLVVWENLR